MIFWLLAAALTLATLVVLLRGALRADTALDDDPAGHAAVLYAEQLREIERDRERGVLDADQAEAASLEIKRRLLRLRPSGSRAAGGRHAVPVRALGIGLALVISLSAGGIYAQLGSPGQPSPSPVARQAERDAARTRTTALMTQARDLERQVIENEGDLAALTELAGVYMRLDQPDLAAEVLRQAVEIDPRSTTLKGMLTESVIAAAGGQVTAEAERLLSQVLDAQPDNWQALYYRGLAEDQAGRTQVALDTWLALLGRFPPGSPPATIIERAVTDAARRLGQDAEALMAEARPTTLGALAQAGPRVQGDAGRQNGPRVQGGSADVPPVLNQQAQSDQGATIAALPPEERIEAIRGMVENLAARLEDAPEDVEGWLRLGRSYEVLGETVKAEDAFTRAAALAPDDPSVLAALGVAQLAPAPEGVPLPVVTEEAQATFERVLALAPDHPEANWYLGLAALKRAAFQDTIAHWRHTLEALPEDHPDHASLQAQLRAVRALASTDAPAINPEAGQEGEDEAGAAANADVEAPTAPRQTN